MNDEAKQLHLFLADVVDGLAATDQQVGDLAAALVALRLTFSEMGVDFEKRYAKHFAEREVQQVIRKNAASHELLLALARSLRGQA